ncbi:MAG: alpha/beta hydrolase domain-containing protein [Acidobacteriaceae bacterium]
MRINRFSPFAVLLISAALFLTSVSAVAKVDHVEVTSRQDVLGGNSFGSAGAYEKIAGKIYFTADPGNVHDRQIVDLDLAPRNAQGEVEYSADFYILRPKQTARGNGAMLFEVTNRGGKGMLSLVQRAKGSRDPQTEQEFGDGFLMNRGYTLAWLGWQWDVPEAPNVLRLYAPVAHERGGGHITGLVRADFTPFERAESWPLSHILVGRNGGNSYDVSDPDSPQNVLTVRDSPLAKRTVIPRTQWKFGADHHSITLDGGFEKGRIYEVVYVAQDPVVEGLGLAGVRDFIAWSKYDAKALAPVKRAYAMGISQSGRFLHQFLYQNFNTDESDRQALDGVLSHVAGAGRGSFNHRFAQPSRDAQPMNALFYPTDLFPFTDLPEHDAVNGITQGLLQYSTHTPKIFYSNTSYEYWGRAASLIHTTADGKADVEIPAETRIYYFAGLQHFSGPFPPLFGAGELKGQQKEDPNPVVWFWRAMITNMDAWVAKNTPPPESVYPHISEGTLVPRAQLKFPAIEGVNVPATNQQAYHLYFGQEFLRKGIASIEPPEVGAPFPALVPQADADGNDLGGVRLPEMQLPLATYTGWNLRSPSIGAPEQRVSFLGSYIPLAKTEAERKANHDPRKAIAERYPSKEDYLAKYKDAAKKLIQQRFIMPEDLPAIMERGAAEWDVAEQ